MLCIVEDRMFTLIFSSFWEAIIWVSGTYMSYYTMIQNKQTKKKGTPQYHQRSIGLLHACRYPENENLKKGNLQPFTQLKIVMI